MDVSLRKSVSYRPSDDGIELDHSIWRLNISRQILSQSAAKHLFSGECESISFDPQDKLLALLRGQGCLSVPSRDEYSSEDVFEVFNGVSLDWYREYYEHDLWDSLRNGEASLNALSTWLIHNYHVSVNAGITHARIGVMSNDPNLSQEHKDCAVEEYWHANSFYFVKNPAINIAERHVKSYIPLAASYAFQLHLRYLSEHDPLGYILVSYYQERTIMFHEGCETFYNAIETNYDMPNLFDGWRKHISLDIELDHRNKRSGILTAGQNVSSDALFKSVNNARKAAQLLNLCLDDIVKFSDNQEAVSLRLIYEDRQSYRALLDFSQNLSEAYISGPEQFSECLIGYVDRLDDRHLDIVSDLKWLENAMNQSLFNLLGRAYYHDDIMVAGDLARIFKFTEQDASVSFALETIRNHLLELSNNMHVEFISTIAFLSALLLKHSPDEHRFEKALQLSISALYKISPDPSVNSDKVCYTVTLIADVLSSSVLSVKPDVVNPNSA